MTLCDVDPIIVGVWRYLIAVSERELRALPDLEPGQCVDDLGLCQEARWLIKSLETQADTLQRVATAIVRQQTGFLEHGALATHDLLTIRQQIQAFEHLLHGC